ncbi:response regulator transcription factor [Psychromonas sp. MME1]|uniref:response regulator transcription factor n=1 Tax=Psychromonas sp. MME1 TaxID=3231032 RepID=UPI0034E1ACBC
MKKKRSSAFDSLSKRELEVLNALMSGLNNKMVANKLNIDQKTVSTYKYRIFKKLQINSMMELSSLRIN